MNTDYISEIKSNDSLVRDLKATLFDFISRNESIIAGIEDAIINENSPERETALREIWAQYNESMKVVINSTNELSSSIGTVSSCLKEYRQFVNLIQRQDRETQLQKEAVEQAHVESNQSSGISLEDAIEKASKESIMKVQKEDTVEVPAVEVPTVEVTEEAAVEAPVVEAKEEVAVELPAVEAPAVEAKEEVAVELPAVEVPTVEVKEEAAVEAPAVEAKEEVAVELPSVEVPTIEAKEEVAMEVPAVDAGIVVPPIVEAPVVEAPVAEEAVDAGIVVPPIVEAPVVEAPVAEEAVDAGIVVPPIVEAPVVEAPVAEEHSPLVEADNNSGIVLLPLEGDANTVEVDPTGKTVFVKDYPEEDRAILITVAQAAKLRQSCSVQEALIQSVLSNSTLPSDEVVSAQQLEQMMSELSSLYEQGKTQEAEAMSERISILSKKLNNVAA